MYKVLIVDDSLTIRKRLTEILESDPMFKVVGEAKNGKEAISRTEYLNPDVITMDLAMPEMSGIDAIKQIMLRFPTPILILSGAENRGDLFKTYDGLKAGAVSAFEKPKSLVSSGDWEKGFIKELNIVARVPVITHLGTKRRKEISASIAPQRRDYKIVAIGASTGGPQVLAEIFKALPSNFPVPIIGVVHISSTFTSSLAQWFNANCDLKVSFAEGGENLMAQQPGRVFLAKPDYHLITENFQLKYIDAPPKNYCRPSIDVLFESVANQWMNKAIGVILTGMGNDGAGGLKKIHDKGGYTIAQDEASSVIFSMPKEAINTGGVRKVLSFREIPSQLMQLL